ncbi:bifunctional diguanylate cyclase/phosphodiesterase [Telmatospirillum sp. J64-1]|uniref:putative bifunctional diguanylate cyclase/phosphodiesterase n=1 Tax=Telmatospirillum sp. J64-1 TaxID=2502183 RepID=UPI002104D4B4|nr:bifunctional diguanylate cyclase/phosphodiesterase [Telmatospirillum sp. J64-1]
MTVLNCIVYEHNIWLVVVAALVCVIGSWAIMRLFYRAASTTGIQKLGWQFLTAVAAGASIWCTHFIAMLAYDPGVPVGLDPVLTIVSLLIAVVGAALGFAIAASKWSRAAPVIGGGVVGLAVAAMHYSGMIAYRVQGLVSWDMNYLIASILLSVGLTALALHFAMRRVSPADKVIAAGVLVLAIVTLHFTGMTAFKVTPMLIEGSFSNPAAFRALALAIACVALLIVGAGFVSYLIDDSVRSESIKRLHHMALNDSLTGLPNRVNFAEHLEAEIKIADETGGKVALIGIDLDRFKEVNDLHGHHAGDEVLKILAERMRNLLQEGEFVARLGGDEFAAVYRMHEQEGLIDFITRLETALFRPIRLEEYEFIAGASLGIALYPTDATDAEKLINNADLAMYRAKADITTSACFYEPTMDETIRARRKMVSELREALNNDQLDVYYQVQKDVASGEICGYEALLRWKHPERGFVSPAEFIPLAEENGLILQIGEWVLRKVCAEAASWDPPYKVSVNLSPVQFVHSDLPKLIKDVLDETGMAPERLELELTESTIINDKVRSLHILRQIKALGVTIALDDFGTGYSSLDTLRSFPFDKIKLDRSFMQEIETSPQAKAIIRAVLALGKSLSVPVLAEGIETEGQLSILSTEGCDEGQGYLLGRPAPLEVIIQEAQIRRSVFTVKPEESESMA